MQALHYLGKTQLRWQDIPDAALVDATDAIVRPLAVAACDLDRQIFAGTAPFEPPFVIGHEFTGEVLARGEARDVDRRRRHRARVVPAELWLVRLLPTR